MLGRGTIAAAVAACLMVPAGEAWGAEAGEFDETFSGDGRVSMDFGAPRAANDVLVLADGRILVGGGGGTGPRTALVRYLPNGELDPSFGTSGSGVRENDFGFATIEALALLPSGKFLAAGSVSSAGGERDFLLARYLADGSPDATFGTDGAANIDLDLLFGDHDDYGMDLAVQPDGKIVVAGAIEFGPPNGIDIAVVRVTTAGELDGSSFAFPTGVQTIDLGGSDEVANAVGLQGDGKIVVGGYTGGVGASDFAIARLTTAGGLDSGFGVSGARTTDFAGANDLARGLAIQPDGKIVLAGAAQSSGFGASRFGLARYSSGGTLDPGFGAGGKVITSFSGQDLANDLALTPAGRLILAGEHSGDFALARYDPAGALDPSFSGDGKATVDFGRSGDRGLAVALQPDGKIVVAGAATVGPIPAPRDGFGVARLLAVDDPASPTGGSGSGGGSGGGPPSPASASPSNAFSFGKLKRKKKKGIAFLFVNLPYPGRGRSPGKGPEDDRRRGGRPCQPRGLGRDGEAQGEARQEGQAGPQDPPGAAAKEQGESEGPWSPTCRRAARPTPRRGS